VTKRDIVAKREMSDKMRYRSRKFGGIFLSLFNDKERKHTFYKKIDLSFYSLFIHLYLI
jgi:hypothetical protein